MPVTPSDIAWSSAILLALLGAAVLYARGRRRLPVADRPTWRRAISFAAALLLIALATAFRFEQLVGRYATARAVQHLLLTELAPLLLWLGAPWPLWRAALPGLRPALRRRPTLRCRPRLIAAARRLSTPGLVLALFVCLFWFWHDRALLAASAQRPWLHRIEIASLFGVALLYWWHITAAAPRLHRALAEWQRIAYAFIGILPIKLTGIVMLFYAETGNAPVDPTLFQVGPWLLTDASLAAIFIWIVGGALLALATIWLAGRALGVEERKRPLPVNPLESDDLWRLPGLEPPPKRRPSQRRR